jgi:hypothetical protein
MKARIHFELHDGYEDWIDLSGDTPEEIRTKADQELAKRGGVNPWSEILSE